MSKELPFFKTSLSARQNSARQKSAVWTEDAQTAGAKRAGAKTAGAKIVNAKEARGQISVSTEQRSVNSETIKDHKREPMSVEVANRRASAHVTGEEYYIKKM